jgi:hypothetical protein
MIDETELARSADRLRRASLAAAVGAACALALATHAGVAASARVPAAACARSIGDAVALQSNRRALVVAGRGGVVARYEPYAVGEEPWVNVADNGMARSAAELTRSGQLGRQATSPSLYCTGVDGVVGIALDGRGALYVADATSVHTFDVDTGTPRETFSPALTPDERIVAIALLPSGGIELAITASPPQADAGDPAIATFLVFPAHARGTALAPRRSFVYGSFLGPVRSITIDSRGQTFVDDDGGEILVFPAGIAGEAAPRRRFYGPQTRLKPARGDSETRRWQPMALFDDGTLCVVNNGSIVCFPALGYSGPEMTGSTGQRPVVGNRAIRGIATDYGGTEYVLAIDPVTKKATILNDSWSYAPIQVP